MKARKTKSIATVSALAEFLHWPRSTLRARLKLASCPKPTGPWSAGDVARLKLWLSGSKVGESLADDRVMAGRGIESPSLERFRAARARLQELEVLEREGGLVSIDTVRVKLNRVAEVLRHANGVLLRQFGNEAYQLIEDAVTALLNEFGMPGKA